MEYAAHTKQEHRMNGICPYFTRFPLRFPLDRIKSARPGQWLLDPFCGGGAALFAARLRGMGAVGIDANRAAAIVARAKLSRATPDAVISIAARILADTEPGPPPSGLFWRRAYTPETLEALCQCRAHFAHNTHNSPEESVLHALLLGMLHGPTRPDAPRYFSNHLPADFAPQPDNALAFWTQAKRQPPRRNVLDMIQMRARYLLTKQPAAAPGAVYEADSRNITRTTQHPLFDWVITSPPYYGLNSYACDQWLRNWLAGGPPFPENDARGQISQQSAESYIADLAQTWRACAAACRPGARFVARIGNIPNITSPPAVELLKQSLRRAAIGWRIQTCRATRITAPRPATCPDFQPPAPWPENEIELYARFEP